MPSLDSTFPVDYENLIIYTGNVMKTFIGGTNSTFHKKTNMEILAAIDNTLDTSFQEHETNYKYHAEKKLLEIPDPSTTVEDRDEVEVIAKLFYLDNHLKETFAQEALDCLYKLLNISHVDTLIVSENKLAPSCWPSLEQLVKSDQVHKLGVTDLNYADLKAFLDSNIEIKPSINHVHVGECNNMPVDLLHLAKEKKIELLHNNDCTTILTKEQLTDALHRHDLLRDSHTTFKPHWVLKYSVFIGTRNVVKDKGYIVVASRA